MIYSLLLILSVAVAFVAFGFIAYTAGRARGFEACYRQMNEEQNGGRPPADGSYPSQPLPAREGSPCGAPAVHLSGAALYATLPAAFTTRALAVLYTAAGMRSYRRAARAACQMTQRWLRAGFIGRTGRGRFIKLNCQTNQTD